MENDIKKKLKAPLDSIISAQEITLCIILKVPQQIWLSNVCNASLLKTFISHSSQKSYILQCFDDYLKIYNDPLKNRPTAKNLIALYTYFHKDAKTSENFL